MDELWKQLPVAGPVGLALIVVVLLFLRYLSANDRANRTERTADREERRALGTRIDDLVDTWLIRMNDTLLSVGKVIAEQGRQCESMRRFVLEQSLKTIDEEKREVRGEAREVRGQDREKRELQREHDHQTRG